MEKSNRKILVIDDEASIRRIVALKLKNNGECLDGRGYPQGLKGEEIPLIGRIIAVADTFDAITSNRAYRSAEPAEGALAIIDEAAGTQLDPVLVQAFKTALHKRPEELRDRKG